MNNMPEKESDFRKISDESVQEKTGRGWEEWFKILDEWSIKERGQTFITWQLRERYKLSPWWAQVIATRYEWERRLRK